MQRRVNFYTLGCKLNYSESSTLARQFVEGGFIRVEENQPSDIAVINTCSVTEHSDKKCRNIIRKIHRTNPDAIIAVTGCYAQLKPLDVAAIEGVDIVLSNNDKIQLYSKVSSLLAKRAGEQAQVYSCSSEEITSFFRAFSSGDRTRAFLKVQDGCDYKCSYCTIHYARGASRNIAIEDVISQAHKVAQNAQREIVITGINTGDFGRTTGEKFIDLLRALDAVEGIERYRISSIEPNLLTDEIIDFCAQSTKFQPHFHIPLQSGSDMTLGAMRRRYTAAKFEQRIDKIRSVMSDAFIGIDVIVGFPGESDEQFMESYNLLKRIRPAFLHIFPFSVRKGTPAAEMSGQISPQIKSERAAKLGELCDELHREFVSRFVGRECQVLFESVVRGGEMFGYSENYCRVRAAYDSTLINQIVTVIVDKIDDSGDLIGVVKK
ncbi:MAG: tRNA (N(6)-L-threonylcarbamoyladenosine(37)-C(2))-methylthiotransferase MtaB [Rikenellaceae bacterium]